MNLKLRIKLEKEKFFNIWKFEKKKKGIKVCVLIFGLKKKCSLKVYKI